MGMFDNLTTEGLAEQEDRLGGFSLFETDAYDAKIKVMYGGVAQAPSKAQSVTVIADIGGKEYRETIWVTDKEGKNYFLNKTDNQTKVALPGFQIINDICLMTTEKEINKQIIEEKVVNVYDYDAKKELPKSVPVFVETIGKEITLGITKNIEDKNKLNESTGKYEPTGETRETNTINKVFHYPSGLTVPEAKAQKPAEFKTAWVEKNKGQVINRAKGNKQNGKGGPPQAGSSSAQKPSTSLFGK